jgi:hypothetical protein
MCKSRAIPAFVARVPACESNYAMKRYTKILSGLAASFLLTLGLHAAAERLDPMTHDAGALEPQDATTDKGIVSEMPCRPCDIDQ